MSKLTFHKCRICGAIFYSFNKSTYCFKCVPRGRYKNICEYYKTVDDSITKQTQRERSLAYYYKIINDPKYKESHKLRDRARWHKRMADPLFREKERLRSLARAKARKLTQSKNNLGGNDEN
jgi:hypothetical protein